MAIANPRRKILLAFLTPLYGTYISAFWVLFFPFFLFPVGYQPTAKNRPMPENPSKRKPAEAGNRYTPS
jgi:hypothetical protein